jgi:hypothetical protein
VKLPRDATAEVIARLVRSFLESPTALERMPGRLAIVGFNGMRFRPV